MRASDRRSKSVEHRRRRKFVKMKPRSKDDLDFGTFTVIGRPPNPWTLENSLRRGKSLPNMNEASSESATNSSQAILYQNHTGSIETSSTQETSQTMIVQSPSIEAQTTIVSASTSQNMTVQSSNNEVQTSSLSVSRSNEQQYHERSSVKVNFVAAKKMELTSKTMTELNVGELKRYFQECLITIKTSQEEKHADVMLRQSDRQCIDDLTRSFENLVEIIGLREDMLLSQLSPPQQQQQQQQQQLQPPPRIRINFQTDNIISITMGDNTNMTDLFECSVDLFQDFLNQLLPNARNIDEPVVENDDEGEDEPGFRTMIGKHFQ